MGFLGPAARRFGLLLIIAGLMVACATRLPFQAEPAWYLRSSGPYQTSHGPVFFGIGAAADAGPSTLIRASADNRARKAMERVLQRYLAALVHNSTPMQAFSTSEREQFAGRLLQTSLQHAVVSDHWRDSRNGKFYALCEMHLSTLQQIIRQDGALGNILITDLLSRTEAVHTRLTKTIQTDNQY